jgi:regulator of protease activity HflC (stomatin/prohibitin superfamily)
LFIERDRFGDFTGGTYIRLVACAFVGLVALIVFLSSWFVVSQSERAVMTRVGVVTNVVGPGLHFKMPFVEGATVVSLQPNTRTYEKLEAYSFDQQTADVRLSVTYHVTDPKTLFVNFSGDPDQLFTRIADPKVPVALKQVFGKFTAAQAIQTRSILEKQAQDAVTALLRGYPIAIDGVQIENIDFDPAYEKAIQQQMQKVVALRAAQSEADRKRLIADADSYAKQKEGEGEAAAIRARGDALKENPGIPALVAAEKWDGKLPTTMPPGSAVPFVQVPH